MPLWAHSVNYLGKRHSLEDHLWGTAHRAGSAGHAFGAAELSRHLGLLHDVGKGCCEWQNGLVRAEKTGGRVGTPHKHAGAWLADQQQLAIFAGVVFGHHGGLHSLSSLKDELRAAKGRHRLQVEEAIDKVSRTVPEIMSGPGLPAWIEEADDALVVDALVRMVFSAVVDADYLDTAEHFDGRPRAVHPLKAAELVAHFETARQKKLADAEDSAVNALRRDVYDQAIAGATGPIGMYRMPSPTGSGKTFSSAGFALHHAAAHGLRRVIVAVPFMSITEQNADVYRGLLDQPGQLPTVLEHHSGVDLDEDPDKPVPPHERWRRLAAENWDAPFVVTTTVRLFESLFSNRPAAMRRLHNIAGSVLVLDEVQALPDAMLLPILSMLRVLTEYFNVTVLLASATQPAYGNLNVVRDLPVRDLIEEPQRLYTALNRVRYRWWVDPRPTAQQVAEAAAGQRQCLVVCNTTAQAAELHQKVQQQRGAEPDEVLHLSTRMTADHRRRVLADIHGRVKAGKPVVVVSTQLVEAGVDLDFPVVYRAFATAEAMQQAAGRCNRNGRLSKGEVVIFEVEGWERAAARVYGPALGVTQEFFGPGRAFPDDVTVMDAYYTERFARAGVEAMGARIQRRRAHGDFPAVADLFQMIEEHTVPVIVPPSPQDEHKAQECRQLLAHLRSGAPGSADMLRRLRPWTATLPKNLARKHADLTSPVLGDLVEWLGDYDRKHRGIELSDSKEYVF
ncbi:CRISPR-associated helicase Cas3' [Nocardiopsis sp. HUAS JQ3]|uniref:CRISPR-associated helicase Cas3' n=1 Tax=Nocardiopsis sp. HUAS JQ3 TaxID=3061629 RepID=UPI0023AA162C|nr:CRISPR-associated helicase Cas3' [Nocardiopsis sp. HUAS JQ3]WDZ92795.1 CRISPR-associated helicase Cas3' [Nocardiopsis sp. HUAS JQ3]